jgi:hypothetical protein
MLLIRPDNLSVLDYEIAGSDIGQYILLGRLWRIGSQPLHGLVAFHIT